MHKTYQNKRNSLKWLSHETTFRKKKFQGIKLYMLNPPMRAGTFEAISQQKLLQNKITRKVYSMNISHLCRISPKSSLFSWVLLYDYRAWHCQPFSLSLAGLSLAPSFPFSLPSGLISLDGAGSVFSSLLDSWYHNNKVLIGIMTVRWGGLYQRQNRTTRSLLESWHHSDIVFTSHGTTTTWSLQVTALQHGLYQTHPIMATRSVLESLIHNNMVFTKDMAQQQHGLYQSSFTANWSVLEPWHHNNMVLIGLLTS